ncbi:MAG TPA: alpha-E domain-containing protein [Candidatus Binatia bacterium]|nr:alpha-E domain-containing protein [Candidatus Binatia bacterium]
MLSRVADAIYWMNRYIERAENMARFVDATLQLTLDLPGGSDAQWAALVQLTGDSARFQERFGKATKDTVLAFFTLDADHLSSIVSCVHAARENARAVRESITAEMWEQVNKFYLLLRTAVASGSVVEAPHEFFTAVKLASQLYVGITEATLSSGDGWHFGRLGRLLERADMTARILDAKSLVLRPVTTGDGLPGDDIRWSAVLRSVSALEMYRKRHGRITSDQVTEFLILDREFPRAMHACVARAEESLHALSSTPLGGTFQSIAEQRLGRLRSDLDYAQLQDIVAGGLHVFLNAFQARLNDVGAAIFDTFFAVPPMSAPATSLQNTR